MASCMFTFNSTFVLTYFIISILLLMVLLSAIDEVISLTILLSDVITLKVFGRIQQFYFALLNC